MPPLFRLLSLERALTLALQTQGDQEGVPPREARMTTS